MSRISVHAPHHPRKTPSVEGPLTWEGICADAPRLERADPHLLAGGHGPYRAAE